MRALCEATPATARGRSPRPRTGAQGEPANGTSGRLDSTIFKAGHLRVKALADALFAANDVFVGNKPILKAEFIRVHASIANGVDWSTLDLAVVVASPFG